MATYVYTRIIPCHEPGCRQAIDTTKTKQKRIRDKPITIEMRIFPSLVAARAINQHQVWLVFEDGTEGMKDFAEFLPFAPFHFLREPAFFQQVKVSKDGRVLYWNEDLDFCADALFLELKGLSLDQWKNKQEFHAAH